MSIFCFLFKILKYVARSMQRTWSNDDCCAPPQSQRSIQGVLENVNTKISNVAVAAALLLIGNVASAAPILTLTVSPVGTQANQTAPRDAQDAFLASLEPGYMTETFEGYAAGTQQLTLNTSVGAFTMASAGTGGACTNSLGGCNAGLAILNSSITPFSGRFATSGNNWLDSFDARHVMFAPNAGVNAIGFFINDPHDAGGRFTFTMSDSEVTIDLGRILGGALSNGRLFYLTYFASEDINSVSIYSNNQNDGFGIDDVTIGRKAMPVPEPGSLALLGMGLIGFVMMRRARAS
jgi:hypothetical protein